MKLKVGKKLKPEVRVLNPDQKGSENSLKTRKIIFLINKTEIVDSYEEHQRQVMP